MLGELFGASPGSEKKKQKAQNQLILHSTHSCRRECDCLSFDTLGLTVHVSVSARGSQRPAASLLFFTLFFESGSHAGPGVQ